MTNEELIREVDAALSKNKQTADQLLDLRLKLTGDRDRKPQDPQDNEPVGV